MEPKENELSYITDTASLLPRYSAVIKIGSWHINLVDKTFTPEQIEHMREYFGWEVENLCESQSEI